jgi:hypothetical protein
MAHAHYVVLFAGLMFRKKHATKHRAPVVRSAESPATNCAARWTIFNEDPFRIAVSSLERTAIKFSPAIRRERHRCGEALIRRGFRLSICRATILRKGR